MSNLDDQLRSFGQGSVPNIFQSPDGETLIQSTPPAELAPQKEIKEKKPTDSQRVKQLFQQAAVASDQAPSSLAEREIKPKEEAVGISQVVESTLAELGSVAALVQYAIKKPPMPEGLAEATRLPFNELQALSLGGCQFEIADDASANLPPEDICKRCGLQNYSTLVIYNEKDRSYRIISPPLDEKSSAYHETTFRPDPSKRPVESLEDLRSQVVKVRKESLVSSYPVFQSQSEAKLAPNLIKLFRTPTMPQDELKFMIMYPNGFPRNMQIDLKGNFQQSMLKLAKEVKEVQEGSQELFKQIEGIAELAGVQLSAKNDDFSQSYEILITLKDGSTATCNLSELEERVVGALLTNLEVIQSDADKSLTQVPCEPFIVNQDDGTRFLAFYDPLELTLIKCPLSNEGDNAGKISTFLEQLSASKEGASKLQAAVKALEDFVANSPDIDAGPSYKPSSKDIFIQYTGSIARISYTDPITNLVERNTFDLLIESLEFHVKEARENIEDSKKLKEQVFGNDSITYVDSPVKEAKNSDPNSVKYYLYAAGVDGSVMFYVDFVDPFSEQPTLFACPTVPELQLFLKARENARLVKSGLPDLPISAENAERPVIFSQTSLEAFSLTCHYGEHSILVTVRQGDDINQKLAEFKNQAALTFQAFVQQCKNYGIDVVEQEFTPACLLDPMPEGNFFRTYISPQRGDLVVVYRDPETKEVKTVSKKSIEEVNYERSLLRGKEIAVRALEIENVCDMTDDIGFLGRFTGGWTPKDIRFVHRSSRLAIEISDPYSHNIEEIKEFNILTVDVNQAIALAREEFSNRLKKIEDVEAKLNVQMLDADPPTPTDLQPNEFRVFATSTGLSSYKNYIIFGYSPLENKDVKVTASTPKEAKEYVDFMRAYITIHQQIPEVSVSRGYSLPIGAVSIQKAHERNEIDLVVNYGSDPVFVTIDLEKDNIQQKIQEFLAKKETAKKAFEAEEKELNVLVLGHEFDDSMLESEQFTVDTPPRVFRDSTSQYIIATYDIKRGELSIEKFSTLTSVRECVESWKRLASLRAYVKEHPEFSFDPIKMATESKLVIEPITIYTSTGPKSLYEIKGFIPNTTETISVRAESLEAIENAAKELSYALSIEKEMRLSGTKALSSISHFTDDVEVPPLTDELRHNPLASLDILRTVFDSIKWGNEPGMRNPMKLKNDGSDSSVEAYQAGLTKYILSVKERRQMGAFSAEEQGAVYDELEARTKTLILDFTMKLMDSQSSPEVKAKLQGLLESFRLAAGNGQRQAELLGEIQAEVKALINHAPPNSDLVDTFQSQVLWMAEMGLHCENRWKGDVANISRLAKSGSLAGGEAKGADLNVPEFLHHQIDQLKLGAIDEMLQETIQVVPNFDTSHGTYTMQNAVMRRGIQIPGVSDVEKRDMYAWAGKSPLYETDRDIFDGFMSKCGVHNVTKLVQGALNEHMGKQTQGSILTAFRDMAKATLLSKNPDIQKKVAMLEAEYAIKATMLDAASKNQTELMTEEKKLLEALQALDSKRMKLIDNDLPTEEIESEINKLLEQIKDLNIATDKSTKLNGYKELLESWHIDVESPQEKRTALSKRIFPQIEDALDTLLKEAGYLNIEEDPITLTPNYEVTYDGALNVLISFGFISSREEVQHHALKEMKAINERLEALQLESRRLELMHVRAEANSEKDLAESISNRKVEVAALHEALQKERIELVKRAFPENPVYALAIPRTVGANTTFYTAASETKLQGIIKRGIVLDPNKPATMYDSNFRRGATQQWEGLEMGQRGVYFSRDEVPYLGEKSPFALRLHTTGAIEGVSIPPVSELKKVGFSDEDINKGYAKLQTDYAFLQHEGLPPSDTEVVFTTAAGALIPNAVIEEKENAVTTRSVTEYVTAKNLTLHESWVKNDTVK